VEAVFRIESPRLIAGLARIVRDVGLAEELAHEALVTALERWPEVGIPDNPGAWLMATAKNRAIDTLRKQRREVDLVRLGEAPLLDAEVARDGVCLTEAAPGVFAAFRADAMSRWIDFDETLAPHRARFLQRVVEARR
jgi:predicted RNA polymerase sigma factor